MQNASPVISSPPPHKRARYEGLARYRRILKLDALFSSGLCLSTKEIARRLADRNEPQCSASTVKRTIYAMRDDFNAPIEYDAHRKGYYYADTSYRLPALFAGEGGTYGACHAFISVIARHFAI